ncbi:MAG: hypothetical protein ACO1RA_03095 [Planctomycetaceae bacterium]
MKKPTLCRRLLQFRLRTLMIAMLILPVGLGWLAQARSKSQKAWDNVDEIKVNCYGAGNIDRLTSPWWRRALGIDLPADITELDILLPGFNEHAQAQLLTRLHAFPHLKRLYIGNPCRTAHALGPLAHFQDLEELTLFGGQSEPFEDDFSVLAKLPKLKIYHDEGTKLTQKSVDILASIPSLEEFSFSQFGGLPESIDYSKLKNLRRLHVSDISSTMLSGPGIGMILLGEADNTIAQVAELENLESLKLERTACSDKGVKHLPQLTNLQHLTLESDYITDACLATLVELPSLKTLELKGKNLTQEAVDQWQAKRPGLTISLL